MDTSTTTLRQQIEALHEALVERAKANDPVMGITKVFKILDEYIGVPIKEARDKTGVPLQCFVMLGPRTEEYNTVYLTFTATDEQQKALFAPIHLTAVSIQLHIMTMAKTTLFTANKAVTGATAEDIDKAPFNGILDMTLDAMLRFVDANFMTAYSELRDAVACIDEALGNMPESEQKEVIRSFCSFEYSRRNTFEETLENQLRMTLDMAKSLNTLALNPHEGFEKSLALAQAIRTVIGMTDTTDDVKDSIPVEDYLGDSEWRKSIIAFIDNGGAGKERKIHE